MAKIYSIGNPIDDPPIYTSNPNDAGLKAYNDSLNLYNLSRANALEITRKYPGIYDFTSPNSFRPYTPLEKNDLQAIYINGQRTFQKDAWKSDWYPNPSTPNNTNLMYAAKASDEYPIGYYPIEGIAPAYKKPVQPVLYKKEEFTKIPTIQPTLNTVQPQLAKNDIGNGATVKLDSSGKYGLYDKYGTNITPPTGAFNTPEEAKGYYDYQQSQNNSTLSKHNK